MMPSDIPLARKLVLKSLEETRRLRKMLFVADVLETELARIEAALVAALNLMTRDAPIKRSRTRLYRNDITKNQAKQVRRLAALNLSHAEISEAVWGDPTHIGRVSEILHGRLTPTKEGTDNAD